MIKEKPKTTTQEIIPVTKTPSKSGKVVERSLVAKTAPKSNKTLEQTPAAKTKPKSNRSLQSIPAPTKQEFSSLVPPCVAIDRIADRSITDMMKARIDLILQHRAVHESFRRKVLDCADRTVATFLRQRYPNRDQAKNALDRSLSSYKEILVSPPVCCLCFVDMIIATRSE